MKKQAGNASTRTIVGGAIALVISAALTPSIFAQCQYSTVVIEGPPCPFGGLAGLIGLGLNNHGHVVGFWSHCSDAGTEAFFWSPETGRVTLPRPKEVFAAVAKDINDHGLIVGQHLFSGVGWKGFVYDFKSNEYTYLEPLHEDAIGFITDANAINNHGIVAGRRSIGKTGEQPYNAVIWDTNTGEVTDLGVMNGPNSEARDINSETVTVGWAGQSSNIGTPFGFVRIDPDEIHFIESRDFISSLALALNESVEVAGGVRFGDELEDGRAILWTKKMFQIIDPLPGHVASGSGHINDLGQMLIRSSPGSGLVTALWQHGEMVPLNSLIAPGGVGIQTPNAINDVGQILARHLSGKAAVLTPVDQPLTDLDANCRTDVHDLIMLLDWWGECPPIKPGGVDLCRADINGDGIVNVFDLLILLGNWD